MMGTLGLDNVILHEEEDESRYSSGSCETNHTSTPLFVKELGDRGRKLILDWLANSEGSANRDNGSEVI
jgi:hypothetical protein